MKRRLWIFGVFLALCMSLAVLPAAADGTVEAMTMPPAYGELEDVLPPEITELLPDGLFSEDLSTSLAATKSMTEWEYLLDILLSALGLGFSDTVGLFCTLLGMILVASVFHTFQKSVGGRSGEVLDFCIRLSVYAAISLQTVGMVETVKTYFSRVGGLMQAMIPVMGGLYAMGGNLGEAAASSELILVFLSLCEYVSATVTPPVCALCMAFALMDAFGTSVSLAPLAARIKGCYTGILGLLTFLLSLALSAQSVITSRADTLGMKGIKYAIGQMLPVVGGTVAGTLGAVADGIAALRGVCGVSGIILLVLLLLPTLIKLLLGRFSLSIVSTVASILGCDGESKLLTEMASLYGYLAAAVAICSVLFVIALTLLIHSGVALA